MSIRMKQIRMIISAMMLLIAVSSYRVWSLHYLPHDPFRTYILYACYVFVFLTASRRRVCGSGSIWKHA